MSADPDLPDVRGYRRWQVLVSALVGILVAVLLVWVASGFRATTETLARIEPALQGSDTGIGAGWVAGNTDPLLDFMIAFIHAADVIMGVFILFIFFLHWAAFRRLAGRMQQPGEAAEEAVAADGSGGEAE